MISSLKSVLDGYLHRLVLLGLLQILSAIAEGTTIAVLIPFLSAVGAGQTNVDLSLLARFGVPSNITVATTAWLMIGALLARTALQIAAAWYWSNSVYLLEQDRRTRLIEAFTAATWDCQSREPAGRLQQLLTTNAEQAARCFTAAAYSLTHALNLAVLTAYAFSVHFVNSAAAAAVLCVLALAARPLTRRTRAAAIERADVLVDFAKLVNRGTLLTKELRVFGAEKWFTSHVAELSRRISSARRSQNLLGAAVPILYQNGSGLLLVIGAIFALAGGVSAGASSAVVSVLLLIRAVSHGQHLQLMYHQLQECVPYLEQLRQTQLLYDARRTTGGESSPGPLRELEFAGVGYSYDGRSPALEGVSFRATAGEIVAVIGPSGAGKSTLAQILLGLRSPHTGVVRINGVPQNQISTSAWFARTAFVPQDLVLEGETIADCIRFHRDQVSSEQVRSAAARAGILAEIEQMPAGFKTLVGERGTTLSHGQRQRLCAARALAGNPELLVFDEPTSALDPASESRVLQTLREESAGKIIFVLAHRAAALEIADKVLVLHDGRVAAFEEIDGAIEPEAYYRELVGMTLE